MDIFWPIQKIIGCLRTIFYGWLYSGLCPKPMLNSVWFLELYGMMDCNRMFHYFIIFEWLYFGVGVPIVYTRYTPQSSRNEWIQPYETYLVTTVCVVFKSNVGRRSVQIIPLKGPCEIWVLEFDTLVFDDTSVFFIIIICL